MTLNINLENININETFNVFYVFTNVGSNLNINETVLTQYGGDFNVTNLTMTLNVTNPFNGEIWVHLKEKNGTKYLTKNIYIHGEDYFAGCVDCCTFTGGSFVFNEWEIDCNFGVGVIGEIQCQFEGGSFVYEGDNLDCNFGVGVIGEIQCEFNGGTFIYEGSSLNCEFNVNVGGEIQCQFNGGTYIFEGSNYDCNFNVIVDDSNVRPTAKITRDQAGTDDTDLISGDTNIPLYCMYVETFNGTSVLSAEWQFRSLTYGGGWVTSTPVTIGQLQNYPTSNEDFEFRVKVVDSNGLVGYSNYIRKYYIDVMTKFQAHTVYQQDVSPDICSTINDEVYCMDNPVMVGSIILTNTGQPRTGVYFIKIYDSGTANGWYHVDPNNGELLQYNRC